MKAFICFVISTVLIGAVVLGTYLIFKPETHAITTLKYVDEGSGITTQVSVSYTKINAHHLRVHMDTTMYLIPEKPFYEGGSVLGFRANSDEFKAFISYIYIESGINYEENYVREDF
jgi:hypothetical protein